MTRINRKKPSRRRAASLLLFERASIRRENSPRGSANRLKDRKSLRAVEAKCIEYIIGDAKVSKEQPKELPSALARARKAAQIIVDNKGEDVKILDLRELTQAFDYFVIGSGASRRQLHSISDEIDEYFETELGDVRRSVSGYQESRWVVLDYGDVVVHLFEPETREFYALEDLWGKGKDVPLKEESTIASPSDVGGAQ